MNVATGGRKPSFSNLGNKLMSHHEDTTTQWRRSTVTEIEEAIDLTWKDPFYDDQPDIIAVFDFPDEDQVAAWFWHEFLWLLGFAAPCYMVYRYSMDNDNYDLTVLWDLIIAVIAVWTMCLVKGYYDYYSCLRITKESLRHIAVTTKGVQMDDTSRNADVRVLRPFANIQFVEIGYLRLHFHWKTLSFPVVQIACDRLPSERTLWSTLKCTNTTIWYAANIEKQKEFIDLVNTMKKRENTHPKEGLC